MPPVNSSETQGLTDRDPSISTRQWSFTQNDVEHTPTAHCLQQELYDRARGVELIFRVGVTLKLPLTAQLTAATFFHRFYMRRSMEDCHRQVIAAACLFLAAKVEEHTRKLKDVAHVCMSKCLGRKAKDIKENSPEYRRWLDSILFYEQIVIETLCFDLVVQHPHPELVELLDNCPPPSPTTHEHFPDLHRASDEREEGEENDPGEGVIGLEDYAWTIANDSLRTPLCLLFPPRVIAATCLVLAQHVLAAARGGNDDLSLAHRVLEDPPNPHSYLSSRWVFKSLQFEERDRQEVIEALTILLEFYASQDDDSGFLTQLHQIRPPTLRSQPWYARPERNGTSQSNQSSHQQVSGTNSTLSDGAVTPSASRTPHARTPGGKGVPTPGSVAHNSRNATPDGSWSFAPNGHSLPSPQPQTQTTASTGMAEPTDMSQTQSSVHYDERGSPFNP